MKKQILFTLSCLTVISSASAAVIFSSNFDAVPAGALADNATVATGLVARVAANLGISSVAISSGDNALQFTDNNAIFVNGYPLLKSTNFGTVMTDATGDNMLTGTFDLTRIAVGVPFQFYIQQGTGESTSGANMVARIEFAATGAVNYFAGITNTTTGVTMALGDAYRFTYSIDLSSTTQDIWNLNIATVATPSTSLFSVTGANTFNPNLTPGIAVFRGGSNSGNLNENPTWQLDNATLNAVPEPSTFALAGLATIGLIVLRRRN